MPRSCGYVAVDLADDVKLPNDILGGRPHRPIDGLNPKYCRLMSVEHCWLSRDGLRVCAVEFIERRLLDDISIDGFCGTVSVMESRFLSLNVNEASRPDKSLATESFKVPELFSVCILQEEKDVSDAKERIKRNMDQKGHTLKLRSHLASGFEMKRRSSAFLLPGVSFSCILPSLPQEWR